MARNPAVFLFFALAASLTAQEPGEIRFNRDIRPILSGNCYYCHGPDEKTREADLRLDTFDGATEDLGGYAAVVPGNAEASELIARIHDEDDLMPPPKSKKTLTAEEKSLLARWIEQGAQYEKHWSFMPLEKAEPPTVKKTDWPKNAIDHFILAQLEGKGVEPSAEADRYTLIRRLYLDLIGLLPSPEEVQSFVSDQSPDAYEKLVDRLLTNPHYGERWGRHWLDQARYADSNGYSIDSERQMWPYRDWVIHALNQDMPFDQFTIDQLAGDLLENPSKMQLVATGFHRNTLINQEGGSDREQFRVESAVDRVNTTGAVWLGLTLGCAQCHTHKFDPITHREYFEMFAFFNSTTDANSTGKTIPVLKGEVFGNPELPPKVETISDAERKKLQTEWETNEREKLRKALADSPKPIEWANAQLVNVATSSKIPLAVLEGGSALLQPGHGENDSILAKAKTDLPSIGGIRLRVLTHKTLPKNGPGSAGNGNFVLTGFEAKSGDTAAVISGAFADHEQSGYPILSAIDGNPKTGWAINRGASGKSMNVPHEAVFVLKTPIQPKNGEVEIELLHEMNANYLVGHLALDFTASTPTSPAGESEKLLAALDTEIAKRSSDQKKLIEAKFVAAVPKARLPKPKPNPNEGKVMIMEELPKPRDTYLLTRGDFTRPAKDLGKLYPGGLSQVAPSFPAAEGNNRLDLAKWLIHPQNPLTPRVTMNRVWMRYFGRGLVETEEDLGSQGSLPTHPELLDWLGLTFIENGWSLKSIHRLIVTSATYRQSSNARPDLKIKDPRNLLLARQERVRIDAEIVRDAALSASGLLTPEIGGQSVYPPQPAGVYAFTQRGKSWRTETGPNRFRRGMYTMFFRSAPYPLFTTFDAPDFSSVCTRRVRSNTPLQALNVANDPVFLEFAQGLAARLLRELPDAGVEQRIERAFELSLSRKPTETEVSVLKNYASAQLAAFGEDLDAAKALLSTDLTKNGAEAENATLVCVARAVLNTDNFITRE